MIWIMVIGYLKLSLYVMTSKESAVGVGYSLDRCCRPSQRLETKGCVEQRQQLVLLGLLDVVGNQVFQG